MEDWEKGLIAIERQLAAGDGETYRKHLRADAMLIVPAEVMDKESTIAAIDAAGGWDAFDITEARAIRLCEGAVLISYRFDGTRGELDYAAFLSSAYVTDEDDEWKLVFHQQTPIDA